MILGDERPPITDQSMPVFPSNPFPGRLNSPPYSAMDLGSYDSDDSWFEHRNTYDLNSKIMLTAIISLSFVVVLVIVLHIYARCVLRRQAGHHAIIRRLGLATVTSEPPKTGLDPVIIASLPIFSYKQTIINGDDDQEDNGQECAVCLSFLENEEMARLLPNCKHTFHAECIDKWLSSNSTCPICRTEAEPRLQPVAREGPVGSAGTAPPLEQMCIECACLEAGNGNQNNTNNKGSASSSSSMSRLSSFKRILSRERSSRRLQSEIQEQEDLERQ